jgi:pimeloyl-ACP methyl ester carboxylesterase
MAAVAELPPLIAPPPHLPAERLQETKERLSRMSLDAFLGAWSALSEWIGTEDRAHAIAAPTLVVYGELDTAFVEPAAWFGRTIPDVMVEGIPECGHSPQFERPALYNAALRRHLDRNARAAAK